MTDVSQVIGTALSPAKINLGLSVLGRRDDGFHDIDTIIQAITIFDRLTMQFPGNGSVWSDDPALRGADNLIARAARSLAGRTGRALDVDFRLEKRIPVAAGLGGGSSNGAAAIQLLAQHWQLEPDDIALVDAAADTGSDVPFFLFGGTARATGRGEIIKQEPPRETTWCVLAVPPVQIQQKTARLYGALTIADFAGSQTAVATLHNAFSRVLYDNFPEVHEAAAAFHSLTDAPVALSGAGPAHFALLPDLRSACDLLFRCGRDERLQECRLLLARSMSGPPPVRCLRNQAHT